MDEYIKGAFFGGFILCIFMLAFPKHQTCEVNLDGQKISYVKIGVWND